MASNKLMPGQSPPARISRTRKEIDTKELERLIQAVRKHSRPDLRVRDELIVRMIFNHALRCEELLMLKWEHVDFHNMTIVIERVKRGHTAIHTIEREKELPLLRRLEREQDEQAVYLFNGTGQRSLSQRGIYALITRRAEQAGIGVTVNPHMLRHSKATSLVNQDVPLIKVRDFLGHTSIRSTEHYARLDPRLLRGLERVHVSR